MTQTTATTASPAGLKKVYTGLLKHSGIYGLGQIFSRLTSFLLLPVYTRYVPPADYGCLAILDLVANLLGIFVSAGMVSAVTRYHFDAKTAAERNQVWWTGLAYMVVVATAMVTPAWLWRHALAELTLGADVEHGGWYYALLLPTLWLSIIGDLPSTYLQVRMWSGLYVGVSLGRLCLSIGLNLYFLMGLKLGIVGFLLSNLIANSLGTVIFLCLFVAAQRPIAVHLPLLRRFLQFGGPLVLTALLSTAMHQADRYILRLYLDMDQIGIYALAYTIGQAINTLCLVPFAAIWGVMVYEIARRQDAEDIYVVVFKYFVYGIALVMLASALLARPFLAAIVDGRYVHAAEVIPFVCLAYLFFSLHEHFRVPVMLAKRTSMLPPVFAIATVANIGANLLLIPWFGIEGAALASVVSFATFSFVALWRYRTIARYAYPLWKCGGVVAGMSATYFGYHALGMAGRPLQWTTLGGAVLVWLVWAVVLFGPLLLRYMSGQALFRAHCAGGPTLTPVASVPPGAADRLPEQDMAGQEDVAPSVR